MTIVMFGVINITILRTINPQTENAPFNNYVEK